MEHSPKCLKNIKRNHDNLDLTLDQAEGEVEITNNWSEVPGAKDVRVRTWKIKNGGDLVDGADIIMERGGYTPIQMVNTVDVVVDAPEIGEAYCVVMDTDGAIFVNTFDGSGKFQMVWSKGMIVCWVAKTRVEMTEFESPPWDKNMFTDIDDNATEVEGRSLISYIKIVKHLRNKVVSD